MEKERIAMHPKDVTELSVYEQVEYCEYLDEKNSNSDLTITEYYNVVNSSEGRIIR